MRLREFDTEAGCRKSITLASVNGGDFPGNVAGSSPFRYNSSLSLRPKTVAEPSWASAAHACSRAGRRVPDHGCTGVGRIGMPMVIRRFRRGPSGPDECLTAMDALLEGLAAMTAERVHARCEGIADHPRTLQSRTKALFPLGANELASGTQVSHRRRSRKGHGRDRRGTGHRGHAGGTGSFASAPATGKAPHRPGRRAEGSRRAVSG